MELTKSIDKREYTRFTLTAKKTIDIEITGLSFATSLTALDISEGGVGVGVSNGIADCDLNQPVSFTLRVPGLDKALLRGCGRVKHHVRGHFGIEFGRLSLEATDNVRGFIATCIREESWLSWLKYKMRLVA